MGFEPVEHVCDLLALVGSKSSHVNQSLDAFGSRQGYDRAGIGVSRQYDGPIGPSAATSSAREVSGSGAAIALVPSALSANMIRAQLDPSAHAPWVSTTLTSLIAILLFLRLSGGRPVSNPFNNN